MKKLLLLLLVFPFVFSSCGDDDDDPVLGHEPYFNTSYKKADVKAKEKRTFLGEDSEIIDDSPSGYPITVTLLTYAGETKKLAGVAYMFYEVSYQNYLQSAVMLYDEDCYNTVLKYYKDKYEYLGEESGVDMFISEDEEIAIGISIEEEYVGVIYFDASTMYNSKLRNASDKQTIANLKSLISKASQAIEK